ncbi:MAG TPA: YraN family protein [Solirubrobacteraceae bacterium]|jgi:putative endonuclease|nr:YraN family protein [Solirubrobacteraceae bacterium]
MPPDRTPTERAARSAAARALGELGERLAAQHLERRSFEILARNARTAAGEIDIVACDGETLVFVEVKTSCARDGRRRAPVPLERLGPRQLSRARRLAGAWLAANSHPHARRVRLDAVGVIVDPSGRLLRLDHVEGAA